MNWPMTFSSRNYRAFRWAMSNPLRSINDFTADQDATVRRLIAEAFTEGRSPRETGRLLRDVIGLSKRQAQDLAAFRLQLGAEGRRPSYVEKRAVAYEKKLIRQRALMIARTELMQSGNAAQDEMWRQAIAEGLREDLTFRKWDAALDMVTDDSGKLVPRTCPVCLELNGAIVPFDQPFWARGRELRHPPEHEGCRCSLALVFDVPADRLQQRPSAR